MSKKRKGEIPLSEPASLILLDYGGYTVWMEPEKAVALAASWRKRGKRCCIVRRKVVPLRTHQPNPNPNLRGS